MTNDEKREQLRERIEEGQSRFEARSIQAAAMDAASNAAEFVKKHPVASIGGAIAIGLLVGAATKPGRRLGKKGGMLAALLTDAIITYGVAAIDRATEIAKDGQDKLEDLGDAVGDKARSARREASYLAGNASDKVRSTSRKTQRKASRAVRDLRERISH